MTTPKTIFLTGTMTAVEPLTVTHKDAQQRGKNHRLPRAGKNDSAAPYWPASNIRGALRHALHAEVMAVAKKKGATMDLGAHFMLAQGTDIDGVLEGEATDGTFDLHKELRAINPALSLAGRWKMASRMTIGNAYPQSSDCVAEYGQGARRVMFEVTPELVDELSGDDKNKLSRLMAFQTLASSDKGELKKKRLELLKKVKTAEGAEKTMLNEQIAGLDEAEKALNKAGDDGVSGIRRPLEGFEAFNAGEEFSQRCALVNCNPVEIGAFLATLRRFTRLPYLGAKQAYNFGLVSFEWDVSTYADDEALEPTVIGSVSLSLDEGLKIECQYLKDCLSSWDAVKDELDFSRLV
jgi:hypothetical protein